MIAQIVVFKLKAPELRAQFLEVTNEMVAWLYLQPGFVSYELIEGEESWSDRLVWQTRENEVRGRDAFFNTSIAARILQCVDHDFRSVTGEIIEFK